MAWPVEWDRGGVLGAIEEASGVPLSADDALPDTLIAKAQELGLQPADLNLWIYVTGVGSDREALGWTPCALVSWTARMRLAAAICGHCGAVVTDAESHECGTREKSCE
jgi:hypothetical protein